MKGVRARWLTLARFRELLRRLPPHPFWGQATISDQDTDQKYYDHDIQHDKGMKFYQILNDNVELTVSLPVENHPNGLPRLTSFLASDENFSIFRSFRLETTRLLVIKEIELHQLAKKIHELDIKDGENQAMQYRLTSIKHRGTWDDTLVKLLEELETKINVYCNVLLSWQMQRDSDKITDDLLLKFRDVNSLLRPSPRHHRSVWRWIIRNIPLVEEQQDFVFLIDDFVSVQNSSKSKQYHRSRVEDAIEEYATKHPSSPINVSSASLLKICVWCCDIELMMCPEYPT